MATEKKVEVADVFSANELTWIKAGLSMLEKSVKRAIAAEPLNGEIRGVRERQVKEVADLQRRLA